MACMPVYALLAFLVDVIKYPREEGFVWACISVGSAGDNGEGVMDVVAGAERSWSYDIHSQEAERNACLCSALFSFSFSVGHYTPDS